MGEKKKVRGVKPSKDLAVKPQKSKHAKPQDFMHNEIEKEKKKSYDFLLDHNKTRFVLEQVAVVIIEVLSAFVFAYGFRAFMAPSRVPFDSLDEGVKGLLEGLGGKNYYNGLSFTEAVSFQQPTRLVAGGASGISQVLTRVCELIGVTGISDVTLQSVFYFVVNIPLLILGFLKVGKRFTVYTVLNVGLTSLFIQFIPQGWCELINIYNDKVARALAGGVCTGVASGVALLIGTSTGGVDILSLHIAEKKSSASVGKYSMIINTVTVLTYTVLCFFPAGSDRIPANELGPLQATMALYTIIYFYLSRFIIDTLNIRNRKSELQIITSKPEMVQVLIHGFPHACTVIDAKGGFANTPLKVIYMVVSKSETKKVIKVIKQVDANSFVAVSAPSQVHGKFYIKPLD